MGEHFALVQRAQSIAATDHAALVRARAGLAEAQRELAEVRTETCMEIKRLHAELQRLARRVWSRAPSITRLRGLGRMRGTKR